MNRRPPRTRAGRGAGAGGPLRLRAYVTGRYPLPVYLPYALLWTVGGTALFALADPRVDGWVPGPGAAVTAVTMVVVLLLQRAVDDLRDLDYDRAYNPQRPLARGAVRPPDLAVLLAAGSGLVLLVNAWRWPALLVLAGLLLYTFLLLWVDRRLGWPPGDALGLGMLAGAPVQILVNLYLYAALLHAADLAPSWRAAAALGVALAAFAHLELARKTTRRPRTGRAVPVGQLRQLPTRRAAGGGDVVNRDSAPPVLTPDELLTTTRAVRRRLDLTRPVPRSLVEECLRIAQQAPCGSGRHTPHWIVVTDPATRAAVGDLYRDTFAAGAPATAEADPARRRLLASAAHLARHLGDVPVLVLACLQVDGPLPDGNQAGVWGSLLPAVWSYMLAARARGLGTVWTTSHLRQEQRLAHLLGVPAGVHQAVLVPTAFYRGERFRPAARPPLGDVVHHERW